MFHKRLWVIERLFYVFVYIDFLNSIEFLIVCLLIWFQPLFLCESCVLADLQGNWLWCLISPYSIPVIIDFVYLGKIKWFAGLPQITSRMVCDFRAWRKSFPERFGAFAIHLKSFLKCISLYEWATWLEIQWMERQAFRYSLIACTNKMILLLNINNSNISNKPFIISNVLNMQRRRCYSIFRSCLTREILMLR